MTNADKSSGNPPWRAEDVSVEWLNEVLRNHDDFRSAKISSFGIQRMSEGFVFVREEWRIDLEYENGASDINRS